MELLFFTLIFIHCMKSITLGVTVSGYNPTLPIKTDTHTHEQNIFERTTEQNLLNVRTTIQLNLPQQTLSLT